MAMMQLGRNLGKNFKIARPLSIGLGASPARGGIAMTPPPARFFCSGAPANASKGRVRHLVDFMDYMTKFSLSGGAGMICGIGTAYCQFVLLDSSRNGAGSSKNVEAGAEMVEAVSKGV